MLLVWVELKPVGAKDDVGFELGLESLHSLDCSSGGFLFNSG